MQRKVFSFLEEQHMIGDGEPVVIGVSGGADSVCLFFLLHEYLRGRDNPLLAVHVHHGIRPEAGRDAVFVQELCRQWDVPFRLFREKVPELADEWGLGLEEAGRRVRYEAFEQAAKEAFGERGKVLLATAHHADDQAETMLFRMARGTGLRGLAGIRPLREWACGQVIRPLLCVTREEIEAFLKERQIPWVEDATNESDEYVRNRIRHRILPELREISGEAVSHLAELAELAAADEAFLAGQAREAYERCFSPETDDTGARVGARALAEELGRLPEALSGRVFLLALSELSGSAKDLGLAQVRQLRDLSLREGNREVSLPGGLTAVREYDTVRIERASGGRTDAKVLPREAGAGYVTYRVLRPEELFRETGAPDAYTKEADYDKIKSVFSRQGMELPPEGTRIPCRSRETGDRIAISREGGGICHRSVKEILIDRKVPRDQRDQVPVLAAGSEVLWLVGLRVSEEIRRSEASERIVRITYHQS